MADLLRAADHDATTVVDQELRGEDDIRIIEACLQEGRALVTLELFIYSSSGSLSVTDRLGGESVMALRPGYYLLEKRQLGRAIPRPRKTMSIIAFLRAVQRKEPL